MISPALWCIVGMSPAYAIYQRLILWPHEGGPIREATYSFQTAV